MKQALLAALLVFSLKAIAKIKEEHSVDTSRIVLVSGVGTEGEYKTDEHIRLNVKIARKKAIEECKMLGGYILPKGAEITFPTTTFYAGYVYACVLPE